MEKSRKNDPVFAGNLTPEERREFVNKHDHAYSTFEDLMSIPVFGKTLYKTNLSNGFNRLSFSDMQYN